VGHPPPPAGGGDGPLGARVDCMRNIFLLHEMWSQGKIYILVRTLLG
jgi:hypothetical protein